MGALGSFAGGMFATKGRVIAVSVLAALLLSAALLAFRLAYADTGSSRSIAALGTPVSENFDSLSNSAASSTLPQGFVFSESGSSANTLYGVNNGSSATGDTYSYGTASATDRALGSLRSGSLNSTIGASFVNNTGSAINSLTISYTGEQWRLGTAERSDKLGFSYSMNAASLTSGTYTNVDALDFSSPETANTGIKDGNIPDHRRSIGHTIKGLDIPAGATFFIRWTDSDASGSDDGLAVDDFSLTARANASPVANDDPAYAVNEGQALNVSSANGVLANDTDADGDTLKAVREGGPSNGSLTLSSNGSFIYTPGAEYFGSDAFTYRADDEQATANLSNLATATLTVRPVNDAPSFALPASPGQTATEDDPEQSVSGFTSNISAGPANEPGQNVSFEVEVLNGGGEPITGDSPLFTTDGQPSITGTNSQDPGTLTYTPKSDSNGKVVVRVAAEDTGGTDNGGANRSAAQTFTITVSPANDRPTAADGDGTIAEDGGPTNETLAINLRELVEDGETTDENLTYNVVAPTSGGTLTQNDENGDPVPGMYTFDPALDFNGAVAIPYTAADKGDPSGCTTAEPPAQGCDDEILASEGKTFTVNVTAANDAPVPANDEKNVAENGTLAFPAGNLLINDEPGPATALDELDETTGQSLSVNGVGPAANGTASLDDNGTPSDKSDDVITFEPDENYNSFTDPDDPAGFEYEVCDNGDIPECVIGTVTVEVAPVNAQPNAVSVTLAVVDEADTGNDVEINLSDAVDDVETANADLAYEIEAPTPEQGTLEPKMDGGDSVPGGYIFDPAQNYNTGAGTLDLSYTATDRGDPDDCDDTAPENNLDGCDSAKDASSTVSITVNPTNDAPVANDDPDANDANVRYTVAEDGTLDVEDGANDILANDTDVDEDELSVADSDIGAEGIQPENGSDHGMHTLNADGSFTYKPEDNFNGFDSFTYKATDGADESANTATVRINVTAENDPPVAADDGPVSLDEDGSQPIDVLANDTDVDDGPEDLEVVASSISAPANGTATLIDDGGANDGEILYLPNANYNGPDSFTYKAKDAEGNLSDNEATVAISVSPVADAPIARIDTATTPEDTPFLINVLANDGNPDGGPLTATVADGPDHGTASVITEDGADKNKIQYTPNENFHGSDDLTYEVCDSGNRCDQAQARITVAPVNDAPIANDDSYATDDDETLVVEAPGLLANDTDVDNENNSNAGLRVFQPGQPTYGNLTANEDGSFEYAFEPESADNDFDGTDSFTYTAKDGGGAESQPASVTIEINTVNKKPTAAADEYTVLEDGVLAADGTGDPAINGVLFNDTDPENDTLEARLVSDASHGTLDLEADGAFEYMPDDNYNGPDSFTYRADDAGSKNNLSDEATVSITVAPDNDAPTADSASRATDEDGDGVSIDLSSLVDDIETPNGELDHELTAANGATLSGSILTYNPADDFNTGGGDPVEIEYTVADKGDPNDCDDADENCDGAAKTAENTVNITVRPVNDRPVAGDKSDATTPEETPFTIDVFEGAPPLASDIEKTRDEPGATLAVVRTTNGEHGDVSRDGSALTYTPDADYNGDDSFTYTVRDEAGEEATGEISVSISGVNKPPTATADSFTVAEDETLTGNVLTNDTDSDGDTLTAELVEGPENAAETDGFTLNANGAFTYKPKPNFHGDDSFSYEVCDAGEPCAEATVSIAITPVSDAPVANNDPSNDTSYEATEDRTLTVDDGGNDVLANDTDADGDELSAVKVADPEHGTARLAENGSFVYEPDENFSGSDSFTYRANDGSLSSEVAVVSITVSAVNDKPVPTDDAKSTPENTPLVFPASQLTANDKPGPAAAGDEQSQTLTVTEVGSSEHGAVSLDNGEITFTPAPNYNGPASFEYTVCDDGSPQACAVMEATVNVAISAVNSAPVAGSISRTMDEGGAPTTVNLLTAGNVSDDETADGDLTFALVQNPTSAQGAAILDGSSLTFTPNPNFDGTVNLRYSVTDDGDGDAPAKTTEAALTITVNSVNDAPTAGDADATVREDTPANINVLAEADDSDGDDLEVIIVSQPGKGSAAVNSDGTVRYSPRTNLNGSDSFTYKVSDGDLESGEATVSIAITAVNDAPSAASDTARTTINRAVSINVLANDSDPDGDNLSAAVAGQPAKGRVVKNSNGALKYTPPRNFVGTVSFTYRASDGNGGTSVATVRITVARR